MPIPTNQPLLDLLQEKFASSPTKYQVQTTDDEQWQNFAKKFPLAELHTLTLEDYCLGKGSQPENFSWYIERGLHTAFGRYSPGTSRGHLIYRKQDGSYYRTKPFDGMGDDDALAIVMRSTQLLAQSQTLANAERWDSNDAIARELKTDIKLAIGDARKLRLFHAYNPDEMLAINSPRHLKHFLKIVGYEDAELPKKPFALARMLWEYYLSIKEHFPGITAKGFSVLLYEKELGMQPQKRENAIKSSDDIEVADVSNFPRNTILYGPPGTGKTYETVTQAVQLLDTNYYLEHRDDRSKIHGRFKELLNRGHISFVTFHQSFSYEEFVEGLKVQSNDDGSVRYEIEDGIFKTLCLSAASKDTTGEKLTTTAKGKRIWKMSLGNTLGDDAFIYDECTESGYMLMGYGYGIDFTGASSKSEIHKRYQDAGYSDASNDYSVTSVTRYILDMQRGDLVVISDGNRKFRAIGEITSDYVFHQRTDQMQYTQKREINWLRVYSPSRPFEDLMNNVFSQMTLYELKSPSVNLSRLEELLSSNPDDKNASAEDAARVMIIDEINRGNISKIFGELITLIEDDKRAGQAEELEARLPYSKELFSVPDNVFIIGTMNTADRSLTGMDTALRRRFSFTEVEPDPDLLISIKIDDIEVWRILATINQRIELLLGREYLLGHSYFLPLNDDPSVGNLGRIFRGAVIPQLREYFFDDWEKIHRVLGDHQKSADFQIVTRKYSDDEITNLLGKNWQHGSEEIWEINDDALEESESYIGIYKATS
ncbi:AAA family ATPase [Granulosicoccus sp.]|nr:AAA family ATPase [Granulosicoccus sp.]MDB4222779.1 AAA family ATPase [Granulosicoccus sp.]